MEENREDHDWREDEKEWKKREEMVGLCVGIILVVLVVSELVNYHYNHIFL